MTSEHFVKVYGSILDSSVWYEDGPTRLLWITMLAMADSTGYLEAAIPGLAGRARITMDECDAALQKFLSPDKHSKNQDDDGRRVTKVDGGWQLINYQSYRERRTESQVKRAARQARWRANKPSTVDKVDAQKAEERGEKGDSSSAEEAIRGHLTPCLYGVTGEVYYRMCTVALNTCMEINPTLEGGWIPVTASSQIGRVTWMEDGIPLEVAVEVIRERTEKYQSRPESRGPKSLKYFDAPVREQWERGKMTEAEDAVNRSFEK